MLINVHKLTLIQLDYAVAKSKGAEFFLDSVGAITARINGKLVGGFATKIEGGTALANPSYLPTRYWEEGGAILDKLVIAGVTFTTSQGDTVFCKEVQGNGLFSGNTPLEALCRLYVFRELGTEIEIPEELL